jgi:hypothetical protein
LIPTVETASTFPTARNSTGTLCRLASATDTGTDGGFFGSSFSQPARAAAAIKASRAAIIPPAYLALPAPRIDCSRILIQNFQKPDRHTGSPAAAGTDGKHSRAGGIDKFIPRQRQAFGMATLNVEWVGFVRE